MLYFDHSASSPPFPEVVDTVAEIMRHYYGNPSSYHGAGGAAEKLLKQAASVIAERLRSEPEQIVFTSGGTESNNLAIFGAVQAFSHRGKHLVTSRIEHASVFECFQQLERQGFEVTYLDADASGSISEEQLVSALREDTILVSLMHVNNETGRVQPIERIGALLAERKRILFHVDAVQAAGKFLLDPGKANIDLLSISAHKFHGPRGVGALYRRKGLQLAPILYGGGQQAGLRSGTENVPAIVGMAKAFRMAADGIGRNMEDVRQLRSRLVRQIAKDERIRLTGAADGTGMSPYIVHLRLPGIKSEVFVHALEADGFYVSSQSACASGLDKPSRVLLAMGLGEAEAVSGIRVSLDAAHTEENIDRLAESILRNAKQLRQWME